MVRSLQSLASSPGTSPARGFRPEPGVERIDAASQLVERPVGGALRGAAVGVAEVVHCRTRPETGLAAAGPGAGERVM
jgi:hypothetical protein